jgi:patatin-like phospholipase/acyl hydrolase
LALAAGLSTAQVVELYQKDTKTIFGPSMRRWKVQWLLQARYRSEGLKDVIARLLGDRTLKDPAKPVFIPVTALKRPDGRHIPAGVFLSTIYRIFNKPNMEKYRSGNWSCVDAGLSTSAAPTYFPAHTANDPTIGGEWLLWDGGIVANDRALAVLAELARYVPIDQLSFRILSFGTGYRNITIDAGDWGLNAAPSIISALLDTSVGSTAFYLHQEYGENVFRATPELPFDYEIDDPGVVDRLIKLVDAYCQNELPAAPQPDGSRPSLLAWLNANW